MDTFSPLWFIAAPIALVVGIIVGGMILQAACALSNVQELRFRKAVTLVILLVVINIPVGLGIGFLVSFLANGIGTEKDLLLGASTVFGLVAICVVSGLILCLLLPVSFFRGILVAAMQGVISLVLAGVVGGLALVALAVLQLMA